MATVYPCLDNNKRYRAFPCSQCTAPQCWMGKKPTPRPQIREGQYECNECRKPFTRSFGTRQNYCSEPCRYTAMLRRRRARRVRNV
jgi:hypothetical protein